MWLRLREMLNAVSVTSEPFETSQIDESLTAQNFLIPGSLKLGLHFNYLLLLEGEQKLKQALK